MLVTSQLPIQAAKFFYSFFDLDLCPPHFEKGSATHVASQSECERCFETYVVIFTYIFRCSDTD